MSGQPQPAREPVDRRERVRWLLVVVVVALIGVALRVRALDVDLLSDDYMQAAMIAGLYPGDGYVPFDLYAFVRPDGTLTAHVDMGTVPWFVEPEFHGSVLRPLASLLLWLDHTLAPGRIRLWHAHSLAWLGFAIVGFGLCIRRLLPRWPAAIALALFACEAGFVSPVGWLANRCVLVCTAFGLLAIFVHVEWRRPDPATPLWLRRGGPLIELGLLAASLAGGEYGLGVIAYLFAWELLGGGRAATGVDADAWVLRARALIPAAIVAAIYLGLHVLLGYGTFGADVYADPIHDPAGWLHWAQYRLPKLATAAVWGIPAETISVFEHPGAAWWQAFWPAHDAWEAHRSHMRLGLVGIASFAAVWALARWGLARDERRVIRALLLGAGLGLLPISVAPAHSRLLILAQLGACAAVGSIAVACVRLIRADPRFDRAASGTGFGPPSRPLRIGLGVALIPGVAALLLLNSVADLRWSARYMVHLDGIAEADRLAFTRGDLLSRELAGRDVIVLNGPTQAVGMYGPFVLHGMGEEVPATWRSLALGGEYPLFTYRRDPNTLEVTAIQGAWLRTAGELFFRRANQPLAKGARFDYPSVEIEILADDGAGRPTAVRFRFPHDLDDPRYVFLSATRTGLRHWSVPAVGAIQVVPLPRLPFPDHLLERGG